MAFHEVRFPTAIAFGSSGGPERRTEIVELASGHEERNTPWSQSRRRFNAGFGVRSRDDLHETIAFFEARKGRLHGFRFKDHSDFKSCAPQQQATTTDQILGQGDGVTDTFQISKTYLSGGETYVRTILKPVVTSVHVAVEGNEKTQGSEFTVDAATGQITFAFLSIPAEGETVTAGFEFDVPVRFDTDYLDIRISDFVAGDIPSIPIVEVRL